VTFAHFAAANAIRVEQAQLGSLLSWRRNIAQVEFSCWQERASL